MCSTYDNSLLKLAQSQKGCLFWLKSLKKYFKIYPEDLFFMFRIVLAHFLKDLSQSRKFSEIKPHFKKSDFKKFI